MIVTERILLILYCLRLYKYLTASLVRRWCVPNDKDGSLTRAILRKLLAAGWVKRYKAEVVDPVANSSAPVYVPTVAGCAILATVKQDMSLQLDCDPPAAWQNFSHYVAVSQFLHTLRAAVERSDELSVVAMHGEHDLLPGSDHKIKLHTVVKEQTRNGAPHKTVCVPDAMLGLRAGPFVNLYYLELERGTNTPARCAALKSPGYAGLIEKKLFLKHLPEADAVRVIAACPNAVWRNALLSEMQNKPGKEAWRFLALDEFYAARDVLHEPLLYACDGEPPRPLLKPSPSAAPPGSPVGGARRG